MKVAERVERPMGARERRKQLEVNGRGKSVPPAAGSGAGVSVSSSIRYSENILSCTSGRTYCAAGSSAIEE